ncbi:MAG: phosphate ABC transporter permease PstA [Acidimicrobiales bacterium]
MSDLLNFHPTTEPGHELRKEIRRISNQVRARRVMMSRLMMATCMAALVLAAVPLVLLMYQLVKQGASQLTQTFFTSPPETPSLISASPGGVSNAIVGTIALTIYASIMAIPLGVLVGIYLAETESKFASVLRVVAQTMAGAPSILMGLFAFSFIVHDLNIGFSAIAGSFALAVLMMPVIMISTEIAVRGVPATLREAGLALGAKPHKVSLRIVLPAALTGVVTGVILAVSRAVGETAPVLLVIGGGFINSWQPLNPVSSMPLSIYENAKSGWPSQRAQVWGVALVLVLFVFILSLAARIWAARKQRVRI